MLFERKHAVLVTNSKLVLLCIPTYTNELSMFSNLFLNRMPFTSCHLKKKLQPPCLIFVELILNYAQ